MEQGSVGGWERKTEFEVTFDPSYWRILLLEFSVPSLSGIYE